MGLYTENKVRGNWHFYSNKYQYDYDITPYPEILSDLRKILTILIDTKMLLPKKIEGRDDILTYNTIGELMKLIEQDGILKNCFEFSITGDTIIYTSQGEEIYSSIFNIESFRTFQQNFSISTKSDIWLPMAFDEENYSFVWNLERYNLNYHRLPSVLKELNNALSWNNEDLLIKKFNEIGSLQLGYDLFLSPEIIEMEWEHNPNREFNITDYLSSATQL